MNDDPIKKGRAYWLNDVQIGWILGALDNVDPVDEDEAFALDRLKKKLSGYKKPTTPHPAIQESRP
jgi:hypothetical protein